MPDKTTDHPTVPSHQEACTSLTHAIQLVDAARSNVDLTVREQRNVALQAADAAIAALAGILLPYGDGGRWLAPPGADHLRALVVEQRKLLLSLVADHRDKVTAQGRAEAAQRKEHREAMEYLTRLVGHMAGEAPKNDTEALLGAIRLLTSLRAKRPSLAEAYDMMDETASVAHTAAG